jgi:hypothetical protein
MWHHFSTPHGRSVIAPRVLIWVDVMVTMRNSGTAGQLTIRADGYLFNRPGTSHPTALTHGSFTLGEIDVKLLESMGLEYPQWCCLAV